MAGLIQRQEIAHKTPSGGLERLFGRCLVYIDLNMVRAGVVDHPVKWVNSGYHEIQQPPKRYRVIDLPGLFGLCGFSKLADFQQAHRHW